MCINLCHPSNYFKVFSTHLMSTKFRAVERFKAFKFVKIVASINARRSKSKVRKMFSPSLVLFVVSWYLFEPALGISLRTVSSDSPCGSDGKRRIINSNSIEPNSLESSGAPQPPWLWDHLDLGPHLHQRGGSSSGRSSRSDNSAAELCSSSGSNSDPFESEALNDPEGHEEKPISLIFDWRVSALVVAFLTIVVGPSSLAVANATDLYPRKNAVNGSSNSSGDGSSGSSSR